MGTSAVMESAGSGDPRRASFIKDDNNDYAADYMMFYSGNYVYLTYRPILIIDYYIP